MKANIILFFIISFFFLSCDKREDIYALANKAPTLEINANSNPNSALQQFTNSVSVSDSFNITYNEYLINFKTVDESNDARFEFIVDNNASISLVSINKTETGNFVNSSGVLKVTPTTLGQHHIDIMIIDPYGEEQRITINLNVYLRDEPPVIKISTVHNLNSNHPSFTLNNTLDTFSFSQGDIIIDYQIFDNNSNYTFTYSSTNNGLVTEDLLVKTTTTLANSVVVTGQLKLRPVALGNHVVTITVTDYIGQITTILAEIEIIDIPSQILVNTSLNQFSTVSGYTSTFSQNHLFGQGNYQIKYKIIDDNISPNFSFTSTNGGVLTDLTAQKTTTTVGRITTVEGVLLLTIAYSGLHTIDLKVTEFTTQNISTNSLNVRNNTNPTASIPSVVKNSFANELNITFSGTDPDIAMFNDALIYEVRIEYTNSGVGTYNQVIYTNLTASSPLNFNISAYMPPPSTTSRFDVFVRAKDSFGGISTWKTNYVNVY